MTDCHPFLEDCGHFGRKEEPEKQQKPTRQEDASKDGGPEHTYDRAAIGAYASLKHRREVISPPEAAAAEDNSVVSHRTSYAILKELPDASVLRGCLQVCGREGWWLCEWNNDGLSGEEAQRFSLGWWVPNGSRLSCGRNAWGRKGGGAEEKKAGRRGNAILPTRAPASFKRTLGGRPSGRASRGGPIVGGTGRALLH